MPASLSSGNVSLSALVGNTVFEPVDPNAFYLLETTTLTSSASSVSFTGLDSYTDYKHLQLRVVAKVDDPDGADVIRMNFNNDTGSNYAIHGLSGNGSSVTSFAATSRSNMSFYRFTGAGTGDEYGAAVIDLLDAFNTSKNTTMRALGGVHSATAFDEIAIATGLYINTAAISSIALEPGQGTNLISGSRFSLYGIKAGA